MLFNSTWNYAGALFGVVAALVATPLQLYALGLERYGVLAILSAILAPMGAFNAGVTQSTVRYVASHSAAGDLSAARESIDASLLVNLLIGLCGAAVCWISAPYLLQDTFKIDPLLLPDARRALQFMGVLWLLMQVSGNFRGVLEGFRDQRRVVLGDMAAIFLTTVLSTALALVTRELSWFVLGQISAVALMTAFWWWQAYRMLGQPFHPWRAGRRKILEVYQYSIWQVLNAIATIAAGVADRFYIGIFMSTTTLGAYNVAVRVQSVMRPLFASANQALFPSASAAASQEGVSERLVVQTTWYVAFLGGLVFAGAAVFGPAFLDLWVGSEIAARAGLALRIFLITLLFEIPSATCASYLNAHARTKLTGLNSMACSLVTIACMIPLGQIWGINGVALGGLVGLLLVRVPFHLSIYRKYFVRHVSGSEYFKAFYGLGFLSVAMVLLLSPGIDWLFAQHRGAGTFALAMSVTAPLLFGGFIWAVIKLLRGGPQLRMLIATVAAQRVPVISAAVSRLGSAI